MKCVYMQYYCVVNSTRTPYYEYTSGAYPGFEKVGCLRTDVERICRAQSVRDYFHDLAH